MTSKLVWIFWWLVDDSSSIPHLMGEFDGKLSAKTLCGRTPGPDPVKADEDDLDEEDWNCKRCQKKFDKWLAATFQ